MNWLLRRIGTHWAKALGFYHRPFITKLLYGPSVCFIYPSPQVYMSLLRVKVKIASMNSVCTTCNSLHSDMLILSLWLSLGVLRYLGTLYYINSRKKKVDVFRTTQDEQKEITKWFCSNCQKKLIGFPSAFTISTVGTSKKIISFSLEYLSDSPSLPHILFH